MDGGQEHEQYSNSALEETEPHPMDVYMLYHERMCELLTDGRLGRSLSVSERNKTILEFWNGLSPEATRFWFLQAKESRKEHARKPQQISEKASKFGDRCSTIQLGPGASSYGDNSATSEIIALDEDNLQTPKPILNNAPLHHPKPSKLLQTPTLAENWFYAEKGNQSSIQAQYNGSYAMIVPGSVSTQGRGFPPSSSSTYATSRAEYVGEVHCLPEPCMEASLGPDSLLLQEFDYAKYRARMDASKATVNLNHNLPSTSSDSSSTVNNVRRSKRREAPPNLSPCSQALWDITSDEAWVSPPDPTWRDAFYR